MPNSTSPLLASRTPPGRSQFVVALLALAFLALAARAVWVQWVDADFYQRQGDKRVVRNEDVPAGRGRILDRHGALLATSVPAIDLVADPQLFAADAAQRRTLARLAGMTPAALERRLDSPSRFVYLKRGLDAELRERIDAIGLPGLRVEASLRRSYPAGASVAPIVGFTDVERKGLEGIELVLDTALSGHDGARTVVRDRYGRVVEQLGDALAPRDGQDLRLSIDLAVQHHAYQRLRDAVAARRARSGSAVVLDARSGEILALANISSADPAARGRAAAAARRNRALTDIFEPGSTVKPFTIALALQRGVPAGRIVDTGDGTIRIAGATIRDHRPHGALTVSEVLQKSSNVGTVKLAQQIPSAELWRMLSAVGIGHKPALEFPGVATGVLRPHAGWRPVEHATMSYGYGLSLSLLQLARAYTVFANDGVLLQPTLRARDDGAAAAPGTRVIAPEVARQVRAMLRLATGAGGTAPKAQAQGYSVAGKTGTARKQEGRGYAAGKYRSSFVGLAPADDPRIVVAVMIDEPQGAVFYGGEVAAPVFAEIVQHTLRQLGVAPDLDVVPAIHAAPAVEESL
ncbi:MAG: penicillin-binding protein 2 [Burkholderiales bacterium]|nr:penicillin-binding protein 2 [Burkholderiales bacterium]